MKKKKIKKITPLIYEWKMSGKFSYNLRLNFANSTK